MKKIVFVLSGLLTACIINAQSLDEIIKKYSEANKQDKISAMSTIKITGKMSMMGMDLPLEMWMSFYKSSLQIQCYPSKHPDLYAFSWLLMLLNVNCQLLVTNH